MNNWGNSFGSAFRMTVFGESHGPAVGVVMEGIPAGSEIDLVRLQAFLDLRAPGKGAFSSARKESDVPEFLSGLLPAHYLNTDRDAVGGTHFDSSSAENGPQISSVRITCGTPLTAVLRNSDAHSADYAAIQDTPRPGHADYPSFVKFGGFQYAAGGGHFSGRLTAPLCVAGGICLQLLEKEGIRISSRLVSVGGETDPAGMETALAAAKAEGDSLGGVIECVAEGLPVGLGEHMFGGMENRISAAVFGIPAVKAIEFGDGFALASMKGSESNDAYVPVFDSVHNATSGAESGEKMIDNCCAASAERSTTAEHIANADRCPTAERIATVTNHCGGILGGMTNGMPLVFRVAVKPTPSIAKAQSTVNLKTMEPAQISVPGRHDCCIALRAVPCVTAAAAVAIYDALQENRR